MCNAWCVMLWWIMFNVSCLMCISLSHTLQSFQIFFRFFSRSLSLSLSLSIHITSFFPFYGVFIDVFVLVKLYKSINKKLFSSLIKTWNWILKLFNNSIKSLCLAFLSTPHKRKKYFKIWYYFFLSNFKVSSENKISNK